MTVILNWLNSLGRAQIFLFQVIFGISDILRRPFLLVQQIYSVGVMSLAIIAIAGAFIGMVLALHSYTILSTFGSADWSGLLIAMAVVRELGPVVTGLLFAGRAGSALAAEIGLMKTTEQISAMEMMAVDPLRRVIAPRFYAGIISLPLLTCIFSMMAIGAAGGHAIAVDLLGVDNGAYWTQIQNTVDLWDDVMAGVLKAFVFGIAISWIAVWQGYNCVPTAEGVGRATTTTVVISSLAVLGLNFVLTALLFTGGS